MASYVNMSLDDIIQKQKKDSVRFVCEVIYFYIKYTAGLFRRYI